MKRIGCLRDIITIQELSTELNEYGATNSTYKDYATVRANFIINRGSKSEQNYEITVKYDATVIIRSNYEINEDMIILFNGKKYSIDSIINEKLQLIKTIIVTEIKE